MKTDKVGSKDKDTQVTSKYTPLYFPVTSLPSPPEDYPAGLDLCHTGGKALWFG